MNSGKDAPKIVNAIIEIPKGGGVKYEYDKKEGMLRVDRILHTSMVYPFNYGFVPGTLSEDGDPIDIMVISSAAFVPGSFLQTRPIGVLLMKDEEGVDTKVMAVPMPKVDPDFKEVSDIKDLNDHTKSMIAHFFSYYKSIEPGKWAEVGGWEGSQKAYEYITTAVEKANGQE